MIILLIIAEHFYSLYLAKRLLRKNPDYINYFVAKGELSYPKDSAVFNRKKIVLRNSAQDTLGFLDFRYKFYASGTGSYTLYAWFWTESLSISADSTFRVVTTDNLRNGANQIRIGKLQAGARGNMIYVNERGSWAFIRVPFNADPTRISSDPPRTFLICMDSKSDGSLPAHPGDYAMKSLRKYIQKRIFRY